ncbi:GIY-YIG nuclease family protein [Amylibacter sp.]|nr:GIY-YIG nuclease family protein [Amylibacter sp.]
MAGFVYIMSNASFDGRLKIGMSVKDPTGERVNELNNTTSLPEPFLVEYYCFVDRHDFLEKLIHKELDAFRPNKKREFFNVKLEIAIDTIRKLAKKFGGTKYEYLLHPESIVEELPPKINKSEKQQNIKYPNAKMVIEFNEAAKIAYEKLHKKSTNLGNTFLEALEKQPSISVEKLNTIFEKLELLHKNNLHLEFRNQFSDPIANYYYNFCLNTNTLMAEEFKNTFETLNVSANARNIFQTLCAKYKLKIKPNSIKMFEFIVKDIQYFNDEQMIFLNKLMREVGFYIKKNNLNRFPQYQIYKMSIPLTKTFSSADLLYFIKNEFNIIKLDKIAKDKLYLLAEKNGLGKIENILKLSIKDISTFDDINMPFINQMLEILEFKIVKKVLNKSSKSNTTGVKYQICKDNIPIAKFSNTNDLLSFIGNEFDRKKLIKLVEIEILKKAELKKNKFLLKETQDQLKKNQAKSELERRRIAYQAKSEIHAQKIKTSSPPPITKPLFSLTNRFIIGGILLFVFYKIMVSF